MEPRSKKPKTTIGTGPPRSYPVAIQNMVFTAETDKFVPVDKEAYVMFGRFGRNVFPAVTIHLKVPAVTISAFHTGKLVIAGTKDIDTALLGVQLYLRRLREQLNISARVQSFCVQNVVGSAALPFGIDLGRLHRENQMTTVYTPDAFPGLQYTGSNKHALMFVFFSSGRIVITGAKTHQQIYEAYNEIVPFLEQYRS